MTEAEANFDKKLAELKIASENFGEHIDGLASAVKSLTDTVKEANSAIDNTPGGLWNGKGSPEKQADFDKGCESSDEDNGRNDRYRFDENGVSINDEILK
jgi:hypothetical protein